MQEAASEDESFFIQPPHQSTSKRAPDTPFVGANSQAAMGSRLQQGEAESGERPRDAAGSRAVVNLSDARRSSGGRPAVLTADDLYRELEETRELLDRGLPSAAEARLRHVVSAARREPKLRALARRTLSQTLEVLGRYRDSLEAVEEYESAEARGGLDAETLSSVRVQVGIAHNYLGDHPKAIALLNAELRDATEAASDARLGEIYAALARVYRSI